MERQESRAGRQRTTGSRRRCRRFVVIVGEPADGGSAFRIENPDRLLRVWSLLQATREQLDSATLPPGGIPGLQRQLQ